MSLIRKSGLAIVVAALVLSSAALAAGEEPAPPAATKDASARLMRVYYFRTTQRCASCKKIEAFTDEAIKKGFQQELEDGKMRFEVVNIQEPANSHFIQDYKLFAKSVVIVDVVDGAQVRWKNLEKIWELLDDQPAFVRYVQDEVRQYLERRS